MDYPRLIPDDDGTERCSACGEPAQDGKHSCGCLKRYERQCRIDKSIHEAEESPYYEDGYFHFDLGSDEAPDSEASKLCRSYVEHWPQMYEGNFGLFFSGPVGTGKTFFAAATANRIRERYGARCAAVTTSRFVGLVQSSRNPCEVIDEIADFHILLLDDLGAERASDYALEQMSELIDVRYRVKMPLFVTSNLTPRQIKETQDLRYKRLYDRVMELCPISVVLTGESRREKNRRERTNTCKEILGLR